MTPYYRVSFAVFRKQKSMLWASKLRASNKHGTLINAIPLGIHIEISASPLISAAPLNTVLIRIVTIFY